MFKFISSTLLKMALITQSIKQSICSCSWQLQLKWGRIFFNLLLGDLKFVCASSLPSNSFDQFLDLSIPERTFEHILG